MILQSIIKSKECSDFQDKISKKTPYLLYVESHRSPYSNEYYKTSVLKKTQGLLKKTKIIEETVDIKQLTSFSYNQFRQFLLTYIHLKTIYHINFNPDKCSYYTTTTTDLENQYLTPENKLSTTISFISERLLISFTEIPSYSLDNFVYTNNTINLYNNKLIYMFGLFYLYKQKPESVDKFTTYLGTEFIKVFNRAIETNDFNFITNNIILNSFPDFTTFFNQFFKDDNKEVKPYMFIKYKNEPIQSQINIFNKYNHLSLTDNNIAVDKSNLSDDKLLIEQLSPSQDDIVSNNQKYYKFPLSPNKYIYNYTNQQDIDVFFNKYNKYLSIFYMVGFINTLIKTGSLKDDNKILKSYLVQLEPENKNILFMFHTYSSFIYKLLKPYYYSVQMLNTPFEYIYQPYLRYFNYFDNIITRQSDKLVTNVPKKFITTIYYPMHTLSQFYASYSLYNSKKNLYSLITKIIFYWTRDTDYINKTLDRIITQANIGNDIDIFMDLRNIHSTNKTQTFFDRGQARIKDLNSFQFFKLITDSSEFTNNPSAFTYLDFGGANGELTSSIAKHLKLSKEQVFVSDIKSWFGTENILEYQKNVTLRYLQTSLLPFDNESMDLVSAFQVFHHIKHIETTLKEIHRILKKDGLLLIREHDCDSISTQILIDLDHSIREMCIDETPNIDFLHNYEDVYYSMSSLSCLLTSYGFTEQKMNYPSVKGPTRYYYKVFRKTSTNNS